MCVTHLPLHRDTVTPVEKLESKSQNGKAGKEWRMKRVGWRDEMDGVNGWVCLLIGWVIKRV